jgi:hypothetical protein
MMKRAQKRHHKHNLLVLAAPHALNVNVNTPSLVILWADSDDISYEISSHLPYFSTKTCKSYDSFRILTVARNRLLAQAMV